MYITFEKNMLEIHHKVNTFPEQILYLYKKK